MCVCVSVCVCVCVCVYWSLHPCVVNLSHMEKYQSCISYFFFVFEIPLHDFCCAYLERHNMIFYVNFS